MANPALAGAVDKFADLKRRIWFLIGALLVFRIGSHIPIPGVNLEALVHRVDSSDLLNMINMFSGGALKRASVFSLGIMPYITASIILQLAGEVLPSLKQLKKEGEAGRRKLTQYTRYATVVLASIHGFLIATSMLRDPGMVVLSGGSFMFMAVTSLITGTVFLMWLGEQITERGLGNGISILICAGIASGVPAAVSGVFNQVEQGLPWFLIPLLVIGCVLLTAAVVFMERGQRKIPIQYAKRQVGNKIMQAQNTHLPLKINMSGVIPPIFASSVIVIPAGLMSWVGNSDRFVWLRSFADKLHPGQPIYVLLYAVAIIFFCYFYTALTFNPRETADNLKKSGAMVPGYRPGDHTAKYIEKVILRLTLVGSIYITAVCLVPEFLILQWHVPFYFGGTSLLILVVVTMDFMAQMQSFVLSHQYESLLKKANFKGVA